jgi:hypothetical protein
MERAAIFWRIAMAQMAALNALAADRRKWAMLPDWRQRERRALAQAPLNDYFNEIERIIAHREVVARVSDLTTASLSSTSRWRSGPTNWSCSARRPGC